MGKEFIAGIFILLLSVSLVVAMPVFKNVEVLKSKNSVVVNIPERAVEVAPGIFSLGTSIDPTTGNIVEGYAFVRYKEEFAKPSWAGGNNGNSGSNCYTFLANGAKWNSYENYLVNSTNNVGLDEIELRNIISDAITEWEVAEGSDLFGNEVLGTIDTGSIGNNVNGQNEVVFGSIDNQGVIAVTIVWGIFSGPPKNRYLAEWDMVYDEVDFAWSLNESVGAMDFENIAQHELGHAFGLGHPDNTCVDETMYAYASEGETKKRDLNSGDIAGIISLYK